MCHLVKEKLCKSHSEEFGFLPKNRSRALRQESVKNRWRGVRWATHLLKRNGVQSQGRRAGEEGAGFRVLSEAE